MLGRTEVLMFVPRTLFLVALAIAASAHAAAQCTGAVDIATPKNGATVSSHFQIDAAVSSSCQVTTVHVYMDNRLQFAQYGQAALSGKFNATLGTHRVVVQAWTWDGTVFNKTVRVTVNEQAAPTCVPGFDPNVRVCAPANLTEAKGGVLVHAAAQSSASPVVSLKTFAGSRLKTVSYNDNARETEAAITLPRGLQNITVVARTSNGSEFQNQTNVQIVSDAPTCEAPFISNITPTGGDEPEFPPFLAAADAAACPITGFNIYVDNRLFYTQSNQKIFEGRLLIEPGEHNVVLQAWNSLGAVTKKAIKINVFGLDEPSCMPETDPGVTICQAEVTDNRYVIMFVGTPPYPASPYSALRIYVDNISRATFHNFAAQHGITFLKMTAGTHKVVAVAWTQSGQVATATVTVTVP
ncbi:MAG: Ig-like domain-containing protein [Actinomycetota bacterium]